MRAKLAVSDPAGSAARAAQVLDSFGWAAIVDRTMDVYESALLGWRPARVPQRGTGAAKHVELGG
jgi:hypothetical protein